MRRRIPDNCKLLPTCGHTHSMMLEDIPVYSFSSLVSESTRKRSASNPLFHLVYAIDGTKWGHHCYEVKLWHFSLYLWLGVNNDESSHSVPLTSANKTWSVGSAFPISLVVLHHARPLWDRKWTILCVLSVSPECFRWHRRWAGR